MNLIVKSLALFLCWTSQLVAQGGEDLFISRGFKSYDGVQKFFDGFSREDISKLKYHSNLKISSYAAWLSCRLQCQDLKTPKPIQCETKKTEFLNFLSGRLNSPIPAWWARDLLLRGTPEYGVPIRRYEEFAYENPVNHPKSLIIKKLTKTKIELEIGTQRFESKWDQEDYYGQGEFELENLKCISVKPISEDKFVYAISDESRVLVCCVSRKHGVIWRNLVESLAQSSLQGMIGRTTTVNEIVISNKTVSVFSLNGIGASIGSFDLATGTDKLAFTTYFSLTEDTGKISGMPNTDSSKRNNGQK